MKLQTFARLEKRAWHPAGCQAKQTLCIRKRSFHEAFDRFGNGFESWDSSHAINYFFEKAAAFFDDDLSQLQLLADQAGVVLEHRRLFDEVHGLNRMLERNVSELRAVNDELGAFAYSVSHDLRAPLRAVTGFSEMLLEDHSGQLDEDGRDYLDRVLAATKHMGRLIDDLLNLSRTGRVELYRRPVDLSAMAHRVVGELAAADADSPREVQVRIDDGLSAVGDPALLEIVLRNLISNAWKFSAKTPRPAIHVGSVEQEGSPVMFVRDNGAGFDIRNADRLFAPFQRLHTTAEFAGSGVGLALVARIITRHGGRVWAEGEVGKGAAFYFTLPRSRDPGPDPDPDPDPDPRSVPEGP